MDIDGAFSSSDLSSCWGHIFRPATTATLAVGFFPCDAPDSAVTEGFALLDRENTGRSVIGRRGQFVS